ncbi:MAG: HAD family hydrolase [Gemmatimonadaceae bacterium]|nr:HAD family hydrolase [Gemmatimonadaceae bacterium]
MADDRGRRAALLDRDGTLIADRHYLRDAADVALLPGVAVGLRALAAAGIPAIVCTNQSGIARGTVSLADYRAVRARLDELLAVEGVALRDTFACPHHPDHGLPCDCRKPALGLFHRAAATHGIDLARSIFIGDRGRDLLVAREVGGVSVLVTSTATGADDVETARVVAAPVASSFDEAVRIALGA